MFFLFQPTGRAWNSCDRWPVDVFALSYLALSTDYFVRENQSVSLWREIQFSPVTGTCGNSFCPYLLFVFCYFPRLLNNFFFQPKFWIFCVTRLSAWVPCRFCVCSPYISSLFAYHSIVKPCCLSYVGFNLHVADFVIVVIVVVNGDCYCCYWWWLLSLVLLLLLPSDVSAALFACCCCHWLLVDFSFVVL